MKYRLKDRELQRKLDALSGGDFSEKLNTEARKRFSPVLAREVFSVYFGDFDALANRFSAIFELDEIEEAPEYDPNRWNEWPDVEPPEYVLMQVEFKEKGKETLYRSCWKWSGFEWIWGDGRPTSSVRTDRLREIRFCPWGDS